MGKDRSTDCLRILLALGKMVTAQDLQMLGSAISIIVVRYARIGLIRQHHPTLLEGTGKMAKAQIAQASVMIILQFQEPSKG